MVVIEWKNNHPSFNQSQMENGHYHLLNIVVLESTYYVALPLIDAEIKMTNQHVTVPLQGLGISPLHPQGNVSRRAQVEGPSSLGRGRRMAEIRHFWGPLDANTLHPAAGAKGRTPIND